MANSEEEIWKSHPDIDSIEVSTLGRVRTLDRVVHGKKRTQFVKGHVLKQCENISGYLYVCVPIVDGEWVPKRAHRLVAQTFIPNPDNLPQVNHKDCNKKNNNVENLEFCTASYNIKYRDKLGHTARNNSPKSPVYAVNLSTFEVLHFRSQHEAGRVLGVSQGNINMVINGNRNNTGGFWFTNDDNNAGDTIKQKLYDIKHR